MNKLIFLTGLLTALLFIGTAHGGQYKETSELEQQILQAMMQDSDALMETIDEEDKEMADEEDKEMANVEQEGIAIGLVKKVGCVAAKRYCGLQDTMMAKKQGWIRRIIRTIGKVFRTVGDVIKNIVTKKTFCAAIKFACVQERCG